MPTNRIAELLEEYRLACQTILIVYGLELGLVEDIGEKKDLDGYMAGNHALLSVMNKDIEVSFRLKEHIKLYDAMVDELTEVQTELEQNLKPLLEEQFNQLARDQPNLWKQLTSDYLLRSHSDILIHSARGKAQLVMTLFAKDQDPRECLAMSLEQQFTLAHSIEQEQQSLQTFEKEVTEAKAALIKQAFGFSELTAKKGFLMNRQNNCVWRKSNVLLRLKKI